MSLATIIDTPSKVHYSQYLTNENEPSEEEGKPSEPVTPAATEAE